VANSNGIFFMMCEKDVSAKFDFLWENPETMPARR